MVEGGFLKCLVGRVIGARTLANAISALLQRTERMAEGVANAPMPRMLWGSAGGRSMGVQIERGHAPLDRSGCGAHMRPISRVQRCVRMKFALWRRARERLRASSGAIRWGARGGLRHLSLVSVTQTMRF
jgi:hypothetical protein